MATPGNPDRIRAWVSSFREPDVVGVEQGDELAARLRDAQVARGAQAAIRIPSCSR